ncbi:hypothetical protein HZA76_00580 [Candidatus Roizmanbacteria bacterium]|nr:hypothetical protein [Candidatus Roizmanbacteria bacterium]
MADGAPTPEMIKAGQEAVARPAGLAAGSVEQQIIKDVKNANMAEAYNLMAGKQPDYAAIDRLIPNNFGYKDHTGVAQLTPTEGALLTEAQQIKNYLQEYATKGLNAGLSANARDYVVNNYAQVILTSPQLADRFVGMSPGLAITEARRIAAEHLKDPRLQRQVAEQIAQIADIAKPIEDKVTPVEEELHRLRQEEQRLKDLYDGTDGAKGKHDKKETQVKEYIQTEQPSGSGTFVDGVKLARIKALESSKAAAEAQRTNLENTIIPGLTDDLANLQSELRASLDAIGSAPTGTANMTAYLTSLGLRATTTIQTEITAKQGELRGKRTDLSVKVRESKEAETEANQLREEKQRYEAELKELETKMEKAKEAWEKAKDTGDKKETERNRLWTQKETAETQWVDQLRKIIPEISAGELQKAMQTGVNKAKEIMDKRTEEEKDSGKKRFWEFEKQQYIGPDGKPIKGTINTDRLSLMRAGTDYQFTLSNGNVERIFLNGAEQTLVDVMVRGGMTNDAIYNLVKDPTTRAEMSVTLAQDILTTFLWSGGRLSNQGEVIAIQRSDWGKGMVAKAMAGRTDLQAQVDAVIGKDVLKWDKDILAQLGKIDWTKFAAILFLIVGGFTLFSILKK